MKTIFFDCFSGVAGDMAVGALLDLGVSGDEVVKRVQGIGIDGLKVLSREVSRCGIRAVQFHVSLEEDPAHRTFRDIQAMIQRADLGSEASSLALSIFDRLATVEGSIHGTVKDDVAFHELGAADSIADIVGFCVAFTLLGSPEVIVSRIPWFRGTVRAAHGSLPLPAPATAKLLEGFTLEDSDHEEEMVTPTGAAILSTLACQSGGFGSMKLERVGYGAGTRDPEGWPNVLRVVMGDTSEGSQAQPGSVLTGQVLLVEANIDDMDPRLFPGLLESLFNVGALDAWLTPVQMKKGRPGNVVSALVKSTQLRAVANVFFEESTTLGVRYRIVERLECSREFVVCPTRYGEIRFKVAGGNARPEFEDCRQAALVAGVPVSHVLENASQDYRDHQEGCGN